MDTRAAYQLGALLSLRRAGVLKEAASVPPTWSSRLKGLYEDLLGKNVQRAMEAEKKKIMDLPYVRKKFMDYPGDMSTFESYITKALKDKKKYIPRISDLKVENVPLSQKKLFEALRAGNKEVGQQVKRTRTTRLGATGALAAPVLGAALYKSSSAEDYAPTIAGLSVGSIPVIQGITSGALGLPENKKLRARRIEEIRKIIRPGDILLTSSPGTYKFKTAINTTGADPYGFHVENVISVPKKGTPMFVHSHPGIGGGGSSPFLADLSRNQDYIVKRFKDPSHTQKFLKNLEDLTARENILEEMLGPRARRRMYDMDTAIKAGVKSFLPNFVRRATSGKAKPPPGATVCSSLPGMASPVCLAPGVPRHEVLPHHIQHSPVLETVGHYRAPRGLRGHLVDTALRASPWLLRGALGAGLGYGAYKGLQALLD